ncbi:Retrovirus-related Pol polyprotein from transposon RE1 [Vitis vinifera]|uniref:Retrovirus-related Pol polyprotein from transposon RE1 n=1 Tax=Vitis vinifera TaxID=29760 RepID=A0A438ICC5_VITVI|nr:Retrovirus-related Pol polyprotein from transposon RE1 [Vitis vinifera]
MARAADQSIRLPAPTLVAQQTARPSSAAQQAVRPVAQPAATTSHGTEILDILSLWYPTAINHPKTSPNIDKSTFKCTHCNKTVPPVWISHNFKAMTLGEYHKEIQTLDYDYHISEEDESGQSELVNQEAAIPNSVQEALADPRWKAAMNEEMKSLQKNETWELVECPPGKKQLGVVGSILCKPRLAITTFDVKNAFLHGELSEEVYMDLPPGCMVSEKQCQKVCKLKKSLYGLKQSPRAWFGRFTKSMRAFGYRQSNSDHTLFLKKQHGKITTLIVYVDDMVVTGNDPEERKALQNYLSREFEMKDLGPLKYFLGIEVSRSSEGIFLSQRKYALDLLQETGMSGCQPVNTPIEEGLKLCVEPNQVSTDKGRYQRLVGRLMYLAHTRPDLAYALSVVSQYMHNPGEQHMNAVMRILRRSTSGYFTFVGGNLVTWKSKKQNVVARSSAEAEFRGML